MTGGFHKKAKAPTDDQYAEAFKPPNTRRPLDQSYPVRSIATTPTGALAGRVWERASQARSASALRRLPLVAPPRQLSLEPDIDGRGTSGAGFLRRPVAVNREVAVGGRSVTLTVRAIGSKICRRQAWGKDLVCSSFSEKQGAARA